MNTHLVYHIEPETTSAGQADCIIVITLITMERSHDQGYFGRIVEPLVHHGSNVLLQDTGLVELLVDADGARIPAPQARYGILDIYAVAIRS